MTYEIISIAALLLCLLIIGVEYIFHYRLAEQQDDNAVRIEGIQQSRGDHITSQRDQRRLRGI